MNETVGLCFVCGKPLRDAVGRQVQGVTHDYHGNAVRTHKVCADALDPEPTVRDTTYDRQDHHNDH